MEHLDIQTAHQLTRGLLDPPERQRWERHVAHCARCRELLASERAFENLLALGAEAGPHAAPAVDALLDRVPQLVPARVRVQRRQIAILAAEILGIAVLGLLAWHGGVGASPAEPATTTELHLSARLQEQVIANLPALSALERDPWLAEQYDAVRTLEQLIGEHQP